MDVLFASTRSTLEGGRRKRREAISLDAISGHVGTPIVTLTYLEYEIIHFVGLRDIRINYFPKSSLGDGPSSYLEYLIF